MNPQPAEQLDYRGKPRKKYQTFNKQPTRTKQADAKKADISHILRQYEQVGIVEHLNQVEGRYMDVSEFTDFADALRQVDAAEEQFMTLPSKVRELFNHDVAEWLDAAHDPERIKELELLINPPQDTPEPEASPPPSGDSPPE